MVDLLCEFLGLSVGNAGGLVVVGKGVSRSMRIVVRNGGRQLVVSGNIMFGGKRV